MRLMYFGSALGSMPPENGFRDLKLVLILAQMSASSTIAPLVLADTSTRLDRVKRGESA
ncbi:conserved hypothetical protein [Ricinus communis]|uniref:Uncharacterized protein n=1 Tax=Ricinus communis TaxID=3988 RepID=B9RSN2_RICCO|nr:conserved hypothetical protein [Ricinus communis]